MCPNGPNQQSNERRQATTPATGATLSHLRVTATTSVIIQEVWTLKGKQNKMTHNVTSSKRRFELYALYFELYIFSNKNTNTTRKTGFKLSHREVNISIIYSTTICLSALDGMVKRHQASTEMNEWLHLKLFTSCSTISHSRQCTYGAFPRLLRGSA